jgi:hypothetical protein
MLHFKWLLDKQRTWVTPYQEVQLSRFPPWDQMIHLRNEQGFKEPKRVDKQVDVLSTVGALSLSSSTSINASIEEVQLHCQSATSQD